ASPEKEKHLRKQRLVPGDAGGGAELRLTTDPKKEGIMRYQISGRQIDTGEALQTHVRTELDALAEKYAQNPTEVIVVFSRNAHEFCCEAALHVPSGLTIQAKGMANEIYAAFANCAEKMEK